MTGLQLVVPQVANLGGLGTGVATALAINVGSAGAPITNGGALGTPLSGTATNLTGTAAGLTAGVASAVAIGGVTGLGTGVATFLATPSSANLASAVSDESGSGPLVFGTNPTVTVPNIVGVTGGGAATAGSVGEIVDTAIAGPVSLVNATGKTVGSYSCGAGQWEITGSVTFSGGAATTVAALVAGISQITNVLPSGPALSRNDQANYTTPFANNSVTLPVGPVSVNFSTSTTIYLTAQANFGVSTCTASGALHAIRVR